MSSDVNPPDILLHELIPLWLVKTMKNDEGIPRVTSDNPNYDFILFLHKIYGKGGSLGYLEGQYNYEDRKIRSNIIKLMEFLASDLSDKKTYYSHTGKNHVGIENYTEIKKEGNYYRYSDTKDAVCTASKYIGRDDLYVDNTNDCFSGMETLLERIRKRIGVLKHNIVSMSHHRIKIYTELYKEILKRFKPDLTEDAINDSLEIADSMWTRVENRIKWGTRESRGKKDRNYDNDKVVNFKTDIPPLSGGKSRKSRSTKR